jgi:glutamyl-tRNA synthetase
MIKNSQPVRVRYAPSPTGPVNLGNIRTALFNWLFARHMGGTFVLRIEDTDKERSKKEYEENIIETLKWLGLTYDEFYLQSERKNHHAEKLQELLTSGKAYRCFCSEEELEVEREAQISSGLSPKYSGKCSALSLVESEVRAKKERFVIRLRVAEKKVSFQDAIRGKVTFDAALIGDIVIAKNIDEPLYNFAVVVDDYDMGITHVIRGEDHISNTPKQILIAEALGHATPLFFAHVPLILGPNRKKLSKRDFAKSVIDFRDEGYLADALINFIALLGWHPENDREMLSREELIAEFSLDRVQKGGGILNIDKLDWLNAQYIKKLSENDYLAAMQKFVPKEWPQKEPERFRKIALHLRERLRIFSNAKEEIALFFSLPDYTKELLVWKKSDETHAKSVLTAVSDIYEKITESDFTESNLESSLLALTTSAGKGDVLWPLRVALSGKSASPGPFECAVMLGKKETLTRIAIAIKKLS